MPGVSEELGFNLPDDCNDVEGEATTKMAQANWATLNRAWKEYLQSAQGKAR